MFNHCRALTFVMLLSMLAGCTGRGDGDAGYAALFPPPSRADDAPPAPRLYQLEVHLMRLPFGAVSHNAEFWQQVDEEALEAGRHDLLYRNGIRVGRADTDDWEHFRDIFNQHPVQTRTLSMSAVNAHSFELEVQRDVPAQDIFYLNRDRVMSGRSYGRSSNLIAMTFEGAPQRPDDVRISLVPMVRSVYRRYELRQIDEDRQVQFVQPERIFDLNFVAELSPGQFLIIAPSREARWPMSIGNRFFTSESESERFEHVILLVPLAPQRGVPVIDRPSRRRR